MPATKAGSEMSEALLAFEANEGVDEGARLMLLHSRLGKASRLMEVSTPENAAA